MFLPPPCCQLFSGALFFSIWGFFLKNAIFNRGLWWESLFRAFFLGKYAPFFCYVDLLAFSSFVSRYFRATANFNNFSGPIFGALMLCFPAFGENVRFHSGFSVRIWAPVLWCFVFQHLAHFSQTCDFQSGFVVGIVIPCVLSREIRSLFLLC